MARWANARRPATPGSETRSASASSETTRHGAAGAVRLRRAGLVRRPTRRSGGSTPTRRCSSAGSGRCCCSRCTRWRWRASPHTPTTATIRGVGSNGRPTSWPRRRSGPRPRRSGRSTSCIACTSGSPARRRRRAVRRQRPAPPRAGSTSPSSTASSPPTTDTANPLSGRARRVRRATPRSSPGPRRPRRRPSRRASCASNCTLPPELRATREAREAARYLLVQPPMPIAARPAYGMLAAAAVALMPTWTRWPLRLPWLPVTEAVALRPAGELVTRTLRWAITPTADSNSHARKKNDLGPTTPETGTIRPEIAQACRAQGRDCRAGRCRCPPRGRAIRPSSKAPRRVRRRHPPRRRQARSRRSARAAFDSPGRP